MTTVLVWLVVLLCPLSVIEASLDRNDVKVRYFIGPEVCYSIDKSHEPFSKKTVIIGDSVCNQMYPAEEDYPNAVSLACNMNISMAGHYFLLKNYLKANQDCPPDTVALILTPEGVQNELDNKYAYHYMLKNFMNREYKDDFNQELWERIKKVPVYWSASLPFIRVSNYSPRYHDQAGSDFALFSPVSQTYLRLMTDLADTYGFKLLLLCPPTDIDKKEQILKRLEESKIREEIPAEFLDEYTETVSFVRDSVSDGLHFKRNCIPDDPFHLL